jgi:hypothetical protein
VYAKYRDINVDKVNKIAVSFIAKFKSWKILKKIQ